MKIWAVGNSVPGQERQTGGKTGKGGGRDQAAAAWT